MLILAIETSCDETSAAVVEDGRLVLSNVVSSQIAVHAPFGGVVPELASRQHVKAIPHVVQQALTTANCTPGDVDLVAATRGPGLAGALLVGLNFGASFALARSITFAAVNHLEGHLYSVWLARERPEPDPPVFPLLALIVSGGHTQLVLVRDHGQYQLVGRTLDDAAGEAYDKVARLLGLGYPGGPAIERAARAATNPIVMPRAWLPSTYDFSFSGLKTAALHAAYRLGRGEDPDAVRGRALPAMDIASDLSQSDVANLAAGFQASVLDVLTAKTARAARELGAASVAVVGGVAANSGLRALMGERVHAELYVSAPEFSTDNAAMIAAAGYFGPRVDGAVDVVPGLRLAEHS